MRVAALYDIHGNLPALEAVLAEVRLAGVDHVVVGGDVFPGPMAVQVLACLRAFEMPVQFIQGNGDREVLALRAGTETGAVPEAYRPAMRWVADQLQVEDEQFVAGWPLTLRLGIDGLGDVVFCHATPRNDVEIFSRLTPEARLRPIFEAVGAPLVVCGHTHMQFDRRVGRVRVMNAGSVGMPFGEPGAYWLLLGPDARLCKTSYDLESAASRIRGTAYPNADEFAAQYLLHPPAEQQMLEMFARAELK